MQFKIKAVIPSDDLGTTPASVLRRSGIVFINRRIWNKLSEPAKKFILLHEEGHHILNTGSEEKADLYALSRYAGSEKYSLKNTLKVITQTLNPERPGHARRIRNIVNHLLLFDYVNFGNEKALKMYTQLNITPKLESFVKKQLVQFLKQKGVSKITDLPYEQRQKLLQEFLDQPVIIELMYRGAVKQALKSGDKENFLFWTDKKTRELKRKLKQAKLEAKIKNYEQWQKERKEKLRKIGQAAVPIVGAVAGIAGAALGVPGVGGAVSSVLGSLMGQKQIPGQNQVQNTLQPQIPPSIQAVQPQMKVQSQLQPIQPASQPTQQNTPAPKLDDAYKHKDNSKVMYLVILLVVVVLFVLNRR